jgi:hypothetical protein
MLSSSPSTLLSSSLELSKTGERDCIGVAGTIDVSRGSVFALHNGGEREFGWEDSMEEHEVEAAAGGMLEWLLLGWFLELGCLAVDAAPIAVVICARFSLVEVMPSWWGRIELRKKSKERNLMMGKQRFEGWHRPILWGQEVPYWAFGLFAIPIDSNFTTKS